MPPFEVLVDHECQRTQHGDPEQDERGFLVAFLQGSDRHGHCGAAHQQNNRVDGPDEGVQVMGRLVEFIGIVMTHDCVHEE